MWPSRRIHVPGDRLAHAAVYLASDEAAFLDGSVIDVDGGRTTVAVIASCTASAESGTNIGGVAVRPRRWGAAPGLRSSSGPHSL